MRSLVCPSSEKDQVTMRNRVMAALCFTLLLLDCDCKRKMR